MKCIRNHMNSINTQRLVIHTFEFITDFFSSNYSRICFFYENETRKSKNAKKEEGKSWLCTRVRAIVLYVMASVKEKISENFVSSSNYINTQPRCRQFISFSWNAFSTQVFRWHLIRFKKNYQNEIHCLGTLKFDIKK